MSGRCCLGQDDGNSIRRAASQRPGHFGGAVIGDHAAIQARLPGAFEQAVADAGAFFTQEMPAIQQWVFTKDDARRIQQPALAVLGTASPPLFAERHKLLLHWLPNAEPLDLPGLTHLLHAQDPAAVANGLTGFFGRHPIPEPP